MKTRGIKRKLQGNKPSTGTKKKKLVHLTNKEHDLKVKIENKHRDRILKSKNKLIVKDTSYMEKLKRNKRGEFLFDDFPEFRPNLSPKEMFQMGSFGGTYWRPIDSAVTNESYKDIHKQFPAEWWEGLETKENNAITRPWDQYDKTINKYGVQVGQTLEAWEDKDWITKYHPYGWVHWYCCFFMGERCDDDDRQIKRWKGVAGPKGRFRKWLITLVLKKGGKWNDYKISPKIRQTLQHWAYQLNEEDFNDEVAAREETI